MANSEARGHKWKKSRVGQLMEQQALRTQAEHMRRMEQLRNMPAAPEPAPADTTPTDDPVSGGFVNVSGPDNEATEPRP